MGRECDQQQHSQAEPVGHGDHQNHMRFRVARPPRKSLVPQKAEAASPRPINVKPGCPPAAVIARGWLP